MQTFFQQIEVIHYNDVLVRNIPTKPTSQESFDDLTSNTKEYHYAKTAIEDSKPNQDLLDPIHSPFNEQHYIQAIQFPFEFSNWNISRYSRGNFGVWYGAVEMPTTLYETVFHWKNTFLQTAQFSEYDPTIIIVRKLYNVNCQALLFDLKKKSADYPLLTDPNDYSFTQNIGEYLHAQYPGILSKSARCDGMISALFTPKVLKNPKELCELTYTLDTTTQVVTVQTTSGKTILTL